MARRNLFKQHIYYLRCVSTRVDVNLTMGKKKQEPRIRKYEQRVFHSILPLRIASRKNFDNHVFNLSPRIDCNRGEPKQFVIWKTVPLGRGMKSTSTRFYQSKFRWEILIIMSAGRGSAEVFATTRSRVSNFTHASLYSCTVALSATCAL